MKIGSILPHYLLFAPLRLCNPLLSFVVLQAETLEDLYEWKAALENALARAPSAPVMAPNGIVKNDQNDGTDASSDHCAVTCIFFLYILLKFLDYQLLLGISGFNILVQLKFLLRCSKSLRVLQSKTYKILKF